MAHKLGRGLPCIAGTVAELQAQAGISMAAGATLHPFGLSDVAGKSSAIAAVVGNPQSAKTAHSEVGFGVQPGARQQGQQWQYL